MTSILIHQLSASDSFTLHRKPWVNSMPSPTPTNLVIWTEFQECLLKHHPWVTPVMRAETAPNLRQYELSSQLRRCSRTGRLMRMTHTERDPLDSRTKQWFTALEPSVQSAEAEGKAFKIRVVFYSELLSILLFPATLISGWIGIHNVISKVCLSSRDYTHETNEGRSCSHFVDLAIKQRVGLPKNCEKGIILLKALKDLPVRWRHAMKCVGIQEWKNTAPDFLITDNGAVLL